MNYYNHHIGDYARDTAHLTMLEDCAYRRMLDLYYASERPLPLNRDGLYRLLRARSKEERKAVDTVLEEFFTQGESGWQQSRCDAEISKTQEKSDAARASANMRWQSERNATASKPHKRRHTEGNAPNSQEPITNSQVPLPSGNGRSAPKPDPIKEEIWKCGRALLEGQGVDTKAAGDFLGKLCKDFGNLLVLEAVRDAVRVVPAEAKGWLIARCQQRKPNAQEALEASNHAVVVEALKHGTH